MWSSPHCMLLHELQLSLLKCEDALYRHGPTVFDWFFQPEFCANQIFGQEFELSKSLRLIWILLAGHWSRESRWNSKLSKASLFPTGCAPLSFANLLVRLKPYEFMLCIEVEPWVFENHDVMPKSLFLSFEHWQQLLWQCHAIQFWECDKGWGTHRRWCTWNPRDLVNLGCTVVFDRWMSGDHFRTDAKGYSASMRRMVIFGEVLNWLYEEWM
jgi:hypothetical protein